jgi:hypothetical protein
MPENIESNFTHRIERKQLADLVPASYNPRTITEEAIAGLGESLGRFGVLAHIVWNERTGNIVGGHQRHRKLTEMGETETDVLVVDLHPSDEIALNIVLNSRHIKGDFAQGAIEALRVAEAQAGQIFTDLKLDDLLAELEKKVKKPKEKKAQQDWVDADPLTENSDMIEPLVVCPKCGSKWQLKDNAVVFDATKQEKKDGNDGK